jgi:hypothetical protein
MNYKNFSQFLFESSEAADARAKDKAMVDKLKTAKEADLKAKKELTKVENDKDASNKEVAKAKLVSKKAEAVATQASTDIQLKKLEEAPEKKEEKK